MAGIRDVTPDLPLIPSRQRDADGNLRAIAHSATHNLVKACFARAGLRDDGRLGTHSLRKTWGYHARMQGVDLALIMHKLNHESVAYTKRYLGITDDELEAVAQRINL